MPKESAVKISSPLVQTITDAANMSIGDGFSYLWKQLMSLPMSYLIYTVCLLIALKILFTLLKHFGVMKKDPT